MLGSFSKRSQRSSCNSLKHTREKLQQSVAPTQHCCIPLRWSLSGHQKNKVSLNLINDLWKALGISWGEQWLFSAGLDSFYLVCLVLLFHFKCFLTFEQDVLLECRSPVQSKQSWHDIFNRVVLNASTSAMQSQRPNWLGIWKYWASPSSFAQLQRWAQSNHFQTKQSRKHCLRIQWMCWGYLQISFLCKYDNFIEYNWFLKVNWKERLIFKTKETTYHNQIQQDIQ